MQPRRQFFQQPKMWKDCQLQLRRLYGTATHDIPSVLRPTGPELLKYKGPIHCARMSIREEGFFARTAGPMCTGSFDVVKTRLMAQSKPGGDMRYTGMVHAIKTIYAEEGLRAMWRGLLPRDENIR